MREIRYEDFLDRFPLARHTMERANDEFFLSPLNAIFANHKVRNMKKYYKPKDKSERCIKLEKRISRMIEMRRQVPPVKFSLIAKDFGVSRQRVDQIARKYLPKELLPVRHDHLKLTCKCGVEFTRRISDKRKFCSRACSIKFTRKFASKEDANKFWTKKRKEMYHNDPEYRAKFFAQQKKYYKKIRHTDKYKENTRRYIKKYMDKMRQDPVWRANNNKKQMERYYKKKAELAEKKRLAIRANYW